MLGISLLFIYFYMSTQKREWGIWTNDLHFMKHGPQSIELPIGNFIYYPSWKKDNISKIVLNWNTNLVENEER
jgi:hypothetical protein